MSDFELAVGVVGTEAASQALRSVGVAQAEVTRGTTAHAQAVAAAVREGQIYNFNVAQTAERWSQATRSTTAATASTQTMGATAQNTATRIASMAATVASLSSRLGGGEVGNAAGLVASIAQVTANSLAMGATMGPGGVLVGALTGLLPIMSELLGANESVTRATDTLTESQRHFSIQLGDSVQAVNDLVEAQARLARQESQRQLIDQGLGSVDQQLAAANLAGRQVGVLSAQRAEVVRQIAEINRQRDEQGAIDSETADRLNNLLDRRLELTEQINTAHEESQRLGQLAIQAAEDERSIQEDILTIATDQARAEDDRAHQQASRAASSARQSSKQGAFERMTARDRRDLLGVEPTDVTGALDHSAVDSATASLGSLSAIAAITRGIREQEHADAERQLHDFEELRKHQHDLAVAAQDAAHDFESGYVTSIDRVIEAWRRANEAQRQAGGSMISQQRLLERSAVASANNIAESVGGHMVGAFQGAVDAWLDGSKSFVEAAEGMAKGVLRALTSEAIVQVVVELARAASAAASSYGTDPSIEMHLVAAAEWAAVGALAGTAGAAVGAFGGGGGGNAASSTETRNATHDSQREQATAGPVTFNVYPGGFITKGDVNKAVVDAINQAGRSGYRVSRGAVER